MSEDGISGIKSPINIRKTIQLQAEEQVVIVTIQAAD